MVKEVISIGESRGAKRPGLLTPRPDAFDTVIQDKATYLTTSQMAKILRREPKLIHRWCQRWYGPLPPARRGRDMGYRIPLNMLRVARGWLQTEDEWIRESLRAALIAEPRDWVVAVGKRATSHYTAAEALERVAQIASQSRNNPEVISVLYVGEPPTGEE